MDKVRSIGMRTSGNPLGKPACRGPTKTAKCTGAGALKQTGRQPKSLYYLEKPEPKSWLPSIGPRRSRPPSDVETLAAAAFALGLRVLELEGLVQTLFDEIHERPVNQRQTQWIDNHFHAARFKNRIFG